jgi:enamine deaminase RidA (YjgF/YER057c/UK114 family)
MSAMQILQPPGWAKPRGFSNGVVAASGRLVFIAGQIGWTGEGKWATSRASSARPCRTSSTS